jgi:transcriptional regulator of aroF, aroG, tyrA and aromatic amino acid transport
VLPIHIPPLNQRRDDIPLLVDHFLFALTSRLEKKMPELSPQACEKLEQHHWPGNIRELKNVVERAAIICEGPFIEVDNVFFSHELTQNMPFLTASFPSSPSSLKQQVADLEKKIIVATLEKYKTVRQSARILEISHPALLNKMKKYQIHKTTLIRS